MEITKEQYMALEKLISYKECFELAMATKPQMNEMVKAYYNNEIKISSQ